MKDVNVRIDDRFNNALADVEEAFLGTLAGGPNQKFITILNGVRDRVDTNSFTGNQYQNLRKQIGFQERKASDPEIKALYGEIKGALDRAFVDSAGQRVGKAKLDIDKDYRNFKVLEGIFKSGAGEVSSGNIPFAALNRAAQKEGTDELKRFTRAGQAILTDKIPSSGTVERALQFGQLGAAGAAGVGAFTNPFSLAPVAGAGILGNLP